jgi:hypothetical protein
MAKKSKEIVQAILAERRACAELVKNWADEIEREKTLVRPEHIRLLARAILGRESTWYYAGARAKQPVTVYRDPSKSLR